MHKNWLLFKIYLIAGTFTFSGGLAMLPLIEREVVHKHHLMTKAELYEYSTLAQTLPGVIALTNAFLVGRKINGRAGMFAAGLGAILPAFILMSLATTAYQMIPQSGVTLSILSAVRAASAAFLFSAAYSLAKFNLTDWVTITVALVCFGLTAFSLVSAPTIIVGAGILGVALTAQKRRAKHA